MMRVAQPCQTHTPRAALLRAAGPRSGVVVRAQSYQQNGDANQLGDKLLTKLRTPFDLLALPGRVAAGALTSLPQVVQNIPTDLERLSVLVTDARPMEEKQEEVLKELETRVVSYMDKGTNLEADVLNNINSVLPQEVKDALPSEVKDFLEKPRLHVEDQQPGDGHSYGTSTTTVMVGDSDGEFEMAITMTPSEIAASQIASEMSELQAAVLELQSQLAALQSNSDPAKTNMLKINVREAREALALHMQQMGPGAMGTNDPASRAAINEAEQLLAEVAALL